MVSAAVVLTAVFLGIAAAITGGATSRRRARSLATALAIWFAAVVLFDVAALGLASWLPSGPASRVLIVSAIANPVDAVRTATLMALEGTTAFGAASLAFLRFTHGAAGAAWWLAASVALLGGPAAGHRHGQTVATRYLISRTETSRTPTSNTELLHRHATMNPGVRPVRIERAGGPCANL